MNQNRIIQCPKRAVSECNFVTNEDQFSDKFQSLDSASFTPNERPISEFRLSVVTFISRYTSSYVITTEPHSKTFLFLFYEFYGMPPRILL